MPGGCVVPRNAAANGTHGWYGTDCCADPHWGDAQTCNVLQPVVLSVSAVEPWCSDAAQRTISGSGFDSSIIVEVGVQGSLTPT